MTAKNNELQLQLGPYRTTFVGIELMHQSTLGEWRNYGETLKRVDEAKQWAIGDWLVDGKRHYKDGVYKEAEKIVGVEELKLRQYKSISERFDLLRRSNNLSWSHHYEVSALKKLKTLKSGKLQLSEEPNMEKMQEFLKKAEKENWGVRELREAVNQYKRRQQEEIRLANEPEKYSVILADPAWEYDFSLSDSRKIDNQYMPSSLSDMKRLKVPAADNCVLFMWATNPKINEALELISAWNFTYKTNGVWVKDKIGMGYYFREKHELILIATRGEPQLPDEDKRFESVFHSDRTGHSEKPEMIYQIIETMYPDLKKLEMFGRKNRKGWDVWGDEVPAGE